MDEKQPLTIINSSEISSIVMLNAVRQAQYSDSFYGLSRHNVFLLQQHVLLKQAVM